MTWPRHALTVGISSMTWLRHVSRAGIFVLGRTWNLNTSRLLLLGFWNKVLLCPSCWRWFECCHRFLKTVATSRRTDPSGFLRATRASVEIAGMACHPMFLWPRFRKKVHSWGRSSRYSHRIERFAEAFGQLVVKHYRVSEDDQPSETPGVTEEWVPVYAQGQEAEAEADSSVVSANSHERSVSDSRFYRKLVVVAVAMICLVYMDELVAIGVIMLTVSVAFASCKFLEESSSSSTTIQQQQQQSRQALQQQQPMPSLKIPSYSRASVSIDNEPRSAPSSPRSSSQESGSIKSRRKLFKSKILASMPAASGNSMASALLSPNMLSRKFHSFASRKEEVDSPISFENSSSSSSAPFENTSCSRLKEIRTVSTKQQGYPGGDQVSVVATILVIVLASLVLGRIPAILAASGSWFIISKLDTMWNSSIEDRRAGLVVGGRAQDEGD